MVRALARRLEPVFPYLQEQFNWLGLEHRSRTEVQMDSDMCFVNAETSGVLPDGSKIRIGLTLLFELEEGVDDVTAALYGNRKRLENGRHLDVDERLAWFQSATLIEDPPISLSFEVDVAYAEFHLSDWENEATVPPSFQQCSLVEYVKDIPIKKLLDGADIRALFPEVFEDDRPSP